MTENNKPTVKDRAKAHFVNHKQAYRDFAFYALGFTVSTVTLFAVGTYEVKKTDALWDKKTQEALLVAGENAVTVADQKGNFYYVNPENIMK